MKNYIIQGKGPIALTSKDFLASGGEGEIYAKGSQAYKIYSDSKKMLPVGKIQELSVLTHPNIIKPEDVIVDSVGKSVGYSMRFVKDTHALCQLFTKAFRDRNGITPKMSLDLVRNLQDIVKHVHDKKILIVDLNEMNFLASQDFKEIYSIDVDSFQTKSFPATALMESVRDRHTKTFSEGTDWFAFAIVSFQLLIGIHPYKGKHSTYKTLDERMINNVSVLNSAVNIPAACMPFAVIPPIYLAWYKAVLDRGERVPPPFDLTAVATVVTAIKKMVGSDHFDIQELESFAANVLDVFYHGGKRYALTATEAFAERDHAPSPGGVFVATPKYGTGVVASVEWGKVKLFNLSTRKEINVALNAESVMKYDNRLYFKSGSSMMEARWLNESHDGSQLMFAWNHVANVTEKSTQVFDGVVFQNLLGSTWVSIFPEQGSHQQIRVKEFDSLKIVDARYERGVLMVVTAKAGKYDRYVLRIVDDQYDLRQVNDITPTGLNFVVLDSGVCVHITEEETVELFSSKKDSTAMTVVDDNEISGAMKLYRNGTKVLFAKDDKLFSMTMKRK